MSQKKVDQYKQEKANRAKLMKREKRNTILTTVILTVLGICIVAFIGVSAYKKWGPQDEAATTKYASKVTADELRETLISYGLITTTADENATTTAGEETTVDEGTTAEGDTSAEGTTVEEASSQEAATTAAGETSAGETTTGK